MAENNNKVRFGLKNVHYATFTEIDGIISYATPVAIPGAVALTLNTKGDLTEFYADDTAFFVTTSNDGYEGDLEIALVPDHFRTSVLGDRVDKNDVLFEDANAIPERFALLYEFNGDKKGTRHVNYNVSVSRPDIEGSTKEAGIDPDTETLEIIATPGKDGFVKARALAGQEPYEAFYDSVYVFTELGE